MIQEGRNFYLERFLFDAYSCSSSFPLIFGVPSFHCTPIYYIYDRRR